MLYAFPSVKPVPLKAPPPITTTVITAVRGRTVHLPCNVTQLSGVAGVSFYKRFSHDRLLYT